MIWPWFAGGAVQERWCERIGKGLFLQVLAPLPREGQSLWTRHVFHCEVSVDSVKAPFKWHIKNLLASFFTPPPLINLPFQVWLLEFCAIQQGQIGASMNLWPDTLLKVISLCCLSFTSTSSFEDIDWASHKSSIDRSWHSCLRSSSLKVPA